MQTRGQDKHLEELDEHRQEHVVHIEPRRKRCAGQFVGHFMVHGAPSCLFAVGAIVHEPGDIPEAFGKTWEDDVDEPEDLGDSRSMYLSLIGQAAKKVA